MVKVGKKEGQMRHKDEEEGKRAAQEKGIDRQRQPSGLPTSKMGIACIVEKTTLTWWEKTLPTNSLCVTKRRKGTMT